MLSKISNFNTPKSSELKITSEGVYKAVVSLW